MTASKIVAAAASGVGGAGLDVDEVFSMVAYEGTGSAKTITNGIDLSGEGGLVWFKGRNYSFDHTLIDTARGTSKYLNFASNGGSNNISNFTSFNNNGFTIGNEEKFNYHAAGYDDYISWTWRKAKKFFDIVTYTGTGSAQTISHNLGTTVGFIFVKCLANTNDWAIYHRSYGGGYYFRSAPYGSDAAGPNTQYWNNTDATSTVFSVGTSSATNQSGQPYIAYLFAHHDDDGGFGPDGDQDIIKCGSYTGNGSTTGPVVNLGFEPQWLMIKRGSGVEDWMLFDSARGVMTGGVGNDLRGNSSAAENSSINFIDFNSTGFQPQYAGAHVNTASDTYIYMAIRRGPLAVPEDATKVFAVKASTNGSGTLPRDIIPTIGFTPDWGFVIRNIINGSRGGTLPYIGTRLTGYGKSLLTDRANSEGTATIYDFATEDAPKVGDAGGANDSGAQNIHWLWKRAPSFCDVVCYTGDGASSRSVSHNLGAVPEMMWVKSRSEAKGWIVYHKDVGATKYLSLQETDAAATSSIYWNDTAPTSSVFNLGNTHRVNDSGGETYIAFLFATASGVSKVGSYTGNGSSQNIDCGFSSGARFVLIKNYSNSDNWMVYDSVRGIVSGNDPYLRINTDLAEYTTGDHIDPYSSGFAATSGDPSTNANGNTYIFYAIA